MRTSRSLTNARRLCAASLLGVFSYAHAAPTSWNPDRPTELHIGSLVLDDIRYTDVIITIGDLVSFSTTGPHRTYDSYNTTTGQLTLSSLTLGGQTYYDITLTAAGLVGIGGWTPLEPYIPNDPLFAKQWHLHNIGQRGADGSAALAGADLNVGKAWQLATGLGIRIAVVDDGLDTRHEDLNIVPGKSWDFLRNNWGDPSPAASSHGTACAGLAAAIGNNGKGVTGVAFNASLVGYNLLATNTTADGAAAVTKDLASNHIYTNSYGAPDGTGLLQPSEATWQAAITSGITIGRGGKGALYTWAAGNGYPTDRSDYDGQANHRGILAIGALNAQGERASYSEPGANLLVSAFGGEYCDSLATTTTDVSGPAGENNGSTYQDIAEQPNYTRCMNGTSAATPQAAGVIALLLEANPRLTWRDVRAILARTARKTDPHHPGWTLNGAGYPINHHYGYGAIDALAATRTALTWNNLPAAKSASGQAALPQPLALANRLQSTSSTLTLRSTGIRQLEFVELTITSNHDNVGQLDIQLISPAGTSSTVSSLRDCLDEFNTSVSCGAGLANGFTFGIARLMDEPADGDWTLIVRNGATSGNSSISAWSINAWGH